MLNKLLLRQIHKYLGDPNNLSDHYKNLFQVISESYDHFEKDRKMLERAIDISSNEMIALNSQLRNDIITLEIAKKALKENSANINAIINNTDDSIFSLDKDYKILSANQSFIQKVYKLTGTYLNPGDYLFIHSFGEQRIQKWKNLIDRALEGEKFKTEIQEVIHDKKIYAEVSFNPIKEKDKVIGVGCFSRNVTQEKLNAEKIKVSENRFRSLIENSQDMISMMNAEGIGEYISPSIERTFGYTQEEVKAINTTDLLHPDDLPAAMDIYKQMLENPGIPIPYSVRNRKKDGEYLWVEGTLTNLLHTPGINAIVGNFRDITEQKRSREKLQNSEANLQTIFNHADTGYVLLDKELKVIYFNQNARQFVHDELRNFLKEGVYGYEIFPAERRNTIKTILESVLQGKSVNYEISYNQPDGKEKWYYARYFPVSNKEGVFGIILSITDFTERKLTEQKIKQSNDRYELATKATNDAIWDWNLITNELYWTDAYEKTFGYKNANEEKNIKTWIEHIHPDDREAITTSVHETLNNPNADFWYGEYRFIKADGSIAHVHDRGYIIYDDERNPIRMVGAMQDITERKKAQEALQKSDGQLREISSSIPGIVYQFMIDKNGNQSFPYISDGIYTLLGIYQEEIYSDPEKSFQNIHPDDKDSFVQSIGISAATMEPWLKIFRVKLPDNTYKWIRGNSIPRKLEDGSILWNGTMIDITESKKNEEALIESEEKLKYTEHLLSEAQQLAKVGNWNVDLTKNEIFWSSGTRATYGVDNDFEPGFDSFISMLHPEDKERVVAEIDSALQTGKTLEHEFRIIRKDGQIRTLKGQTRFELNKEGVVTRIYGISHDVTELKIAEETLRRSEANLRSIFDNTKTSYILLDSECRIQSFNPIADQWAKNSLNATFKENEYWWNYFAPHLRKKLKAKGKNILQGNTVKEEVRFLQADNSIHYYDAFANPVFNNAGIVIGICIAFNDITERKLSEIERERMTAEIIQRNKNLEQFSYIVSHNLRAPVANIIGISTALQEDDSDELIKEELQQGLHSSVLKLDEVILDLNNILQVKHEINERKENVQFAKISNDIYVSIQNQIQNSDAHIIWDFSEVGEMLTLKSYMQSIFYNLIFNSVKYRKPDLAPVIEIKSRKLKNKIELLFRDNCMGIDLQKNGDQVFGLYKRFHNNEIQGKGLGLFMVKTQVEAIGGKISVNSEVNKGTEFKIEFEV